MSALDDIAAERQGHQDREGMTAADDDRYTNGELAGAAACYVLTSVKHWGATPAIAQFWPWAKSWWKPKTARADLVRAGALIVAEIERLDRADEKRQPAALTTQERKALEYVRNAGDGATWGHFIEDHEPVGNYLWQTLLDAGLVYKAHGNRIYLTEAGTAELAKPHE